MELLEIKEQLKHRMKYGVAHYSNDAWKRNATATAKLYSQEILMSIFMEECCELIQQLSKHIRYQAIPDKEKQDDIRLCLHEEIADIQMAAAPMCRCLTINFGQIMETAEGIKQRAEAKPIHDMISESIKDISIIMNLMAEYMYEVGIPKRVRETIKINLVTVIADIKILTKVLNLDEETMRCIGDMKFERHTAHLEKYYGYKPEQEES